MASSVDPEAGRERERGVVTHKHTLLRVSHAVTTCKEVLNDCVSKWALEDHRTVIQVLVGDTHNTYLYIYHTARK